MVYTFLSMENSNKNVRIIVIAAIIIATLGLGYWYYSQNSNLLPIAAGDSIESWDFQGSHNDGPNEQKVRDEITRLEAALRDAETEPTDYVLYVSMANQYVLLGDGKAAYNNLGKALAIDPDKTGMAWHNMGALLERLGAFETARIAYARAVDAQPLIEQYHIAYIEFLMKHFSGDSAALESAFRLSHEEMGDVSSTFQQEVAWLLQEDRLADAIALLKRVRDGTSGEMRSFIETEIQRLEAEQ